MKDFYTLEDELLVINNLQTYVTMSQMDQDKKSYLLNMLHEKKYLILKIVNEK